jgi:large subunit ribosomal protein L35
LDEILDGILASSFFNFGEVPINKSNMATIFRLTPRIVSNTFRTTYPPPTSTSFQNVFPTISRGIKTKSSAKKRFKVLGSGKIKRWQANKRHINSKMKRKQIRQLGDSKLLEGYQIDLGKRLLGLK